MADGTLGTQTPSDTFAELLRVVGGRVKAGDNTAHPIYLDTANQRVGVGVPAPTVPLDVSGAINASGDVTAGGALTASGAVTAKVRPSVSVVVAASDANAVLRAQADYVCDGTADDVQIQAAIDAADAAGGGCVRLSAGTFNTTAQIDIPTLVHLEGEGVLATTISYTGTAWAVYMGKGHSGVSRMKIVRAGGNTLGGLKCEYAAGATNAYGNQVNELHISQFSNSGARGAIIDSQEHGVFRDIWIDLCDYGLDVDDASGGVNTYNCLFSNIRVIQSTTRGIYIQGTVQCRFDTLQGLQNGGSYNIDVHIDCEQLTLDLDVENASVTGTGARIGGYRHTVQWRGYQLAVGIELVNAACFYSVFRGHGTSITNFYAYNGAYDTEAFAGDNRFIKDTSDQLTSVLVQDLNVRGTSGVRVRAADTGPWANQLMGSKATSDGVATDVVTVTVPNPSGGLSGFIELDYVIRTNADRTSVSGKVRVDISRRFDSDAVFAIASVLADVEQQSGAFAETLSSTWSVSSVSGASSGDQTFTIQVNADSGASATPNVGYNARCLSFGGTNASDAEVTMAAA